MKIKKLLSILLVLCMVLTCVPVTARADGHQHDVQFDDCEHMFAEWYYPGGCGQEAYYEYFCYFCGYSYREYTGVVMPHNYVNGFCTICGSPDPDSDLSLIATGGCGDDVYWYLEESGALCVFGEGPMYDSTFLDGYKDQVTSIRVEEGVTTIGAWVFYDCNNLVSVTLPDSLERIGNFAFASCASMVSVDLGNGVQTICYHAFSGCYNLEQAELPASVTKIEDAAFKDCNKLESITLPENLTCIGPSAFQGCNVLTHVYIPASVTEIGSQAFNNCDMLESIQVAEDNPNYSSDEHGVLFDKEKTRLIAAPCNMPACDYILPESVTAIDSYAFDENKNVISITLPANVTEFGSSVIRDAAAIESIWVSEENPVFASDARGVLFNKDMTLLIKAAVALPGTYTVPDGVTEIGENAFDYCHQLTGLIISDTVTAMGYSAASHCENLVSITFGDGLTSIPKSCNYDCQSLTTVVFGSNIAIIDEQAFDMCKSLTSITIPASVTEIKVSAFARSGLQTIRFLGDAPFFNCHSDWFGDQQPNHFKVVTATAYYPASNETWTADVLQNYGGTITWVGYEPCGNSHSYAAVVTDPTCENQGYTTYTCTVCGNRYEGNYVAALGHDCGEWVTIIAPTCTETGEAHSSCTRCDYCEVQEISALGHTYESVVTAPTCTEQGYTTHTCTVCGDSYADTYVDALGHTYESVVTEPTCTEQGYTTHTCTVCGNITVDTYVDALGHDYESAIAEPTFDYQGFTIYTCIRCGDSYIDDYVDPLIRYDVLDGDGTEWSEESEAPLAIRADADITKFVEVRLNSKVVDPEYYTVTEGSTIVTLKPEYLATLPSGEYSMEIVFTDGVAEATFHITGSAVVLGDLNGDGEIDIFDANLIVAYYNGTADPDADQQRAADVNGDGEVDIFDANLVVSYYNGTIAAFPAEA